MDLLHYSGDELLTGTEIGRAVIDYAAALAVAGSSAAVEIPVRRPDGSVIRAHLLIGPASQLAAEPEVSEFPELQDAGLVRRLRAAIEALPGAGGARHGRTSAAAGAGNHTDVSTNATVDQPHEEVDDFELTQMIEQADQDSV